MTTSMGNEIDDITLLKTVP